MARPLRCLLCLSLTAVPGSAFALFGPPSWVKKRPVSPKDYVGIGMALKAQAGSDCVQAAKGKALADLASDISVTVASEFVDKAAEKSGLSEAEVRSEIRSAAQAELESYDAVDSWDNDKECWVYYRLKKADYEKIRQQRKENRGRLALDLWEKGLQKVQEKDPTAALALYVQALSQIQPYLGEGVEVKRASGTVILTNEVVSSLQGLLAGLKLTAVNPRVDAVSGRTLGLDLSFTAALRDADGTLSPVEGLPLSCAFVRGAGSVSPSARTGKDGAGTCRLMRVESLDKLQVVVARVNLGRLASEAPSKLLSETLKRLTAGSAKFELSVSGRPVRLAATETDMDKPVEVPQLEPALADALAALGYSLVEGRGKADLLVELKAAARKSGDLYGMCIAFLDVSLSVTDKTAGTELYKTTLQNVKGMQPDCRKAGLKAYEAALEPFKGEVLPAMTERLKQ